MRFFGIYTFLTLLLLSNTLMAKESKSLTVQEKKENFRKLIVPAVNTVYDELETQYIEVSHYINNDKYYRDEISDLKKIYKVKTDKALLLALKPHPKSIAIAQAAMESAWATSRFFRKANNVFGIWSFNKNDSRIAAGEKRGSKTIWIKKYESVEDSVRDYYKNLGRSPYFKEFRRLRMKTDNPYRLVKKLDRYSELGKAYGKELTSIIKHNKFYLYDRE
ncbi:glucosaminidase domain-containing protein [Sulfurimonas sp.]|uniref:glucosaminidase domain-containing protein n=1 Tax=Sulfurimonas sp. TaxID=2022749 RepID=UPI003561D049